MAIFRRACLQDWRLAGVWMFLSAVLKAGKGGSLCLDCANNNIYAEHLFSFWEPGILVHAMQRGQM